ncbi:hypothetical protein [Halobacteriovorax sp. CON-3]|uniref:hypothetical protein n=1 Tax=Halobacteriovorax sp. CON-3 TaxID=3157710 RepID=UPI00371C0E7F
MIIITSAAYVDTELENEFGKLPPAFLPVGNKKLLELQLKEIRNYFKDEEVLLSLPQSFSNFNSFIDSLKDSGVILSYLDENLSLKDSVLQILDNVEESPSSLRILHGDTFINFSKNSLLEVDVIGVSKTYEQYRWEFDKGEYVWNGFFSYSNCDFLKVCLRSSKNFVEAVKKYNENISLSRVKCDNWYDFGHINTYFKSRCKFTTQRHFNDLNINNGIVYKSSKNINKIKSETLWFLNIPNELKVYTPQLIDFSLNENDTFYKIEYLTLAPLNEMYVHGLKGEVFWRSVFYKFREWFKLSQSQVKDKYNKGIESHFRDLVQKKTQQRISCYDECLVEEFFKPFYYDGILVPSLDTVISDCIKESVRGGTYPGVLHGDLCFSNVLINSRADQLKFIDPRGDSLEGAVGVFGDIRYDLAKLSHSVIGYYDHILSKNFKINKIKLGNDYSYNIDFDLIENSNIVNSFINFDFIEDYETVDILPLTALLFISMVPLHNDSIAKQRAFILNAVRIWILYKRLK